MIDLTYPLFLTLFGAGILTAALVPPIVAHYRLPRVVTLPTEKLSFGSP